MITKHSQTKYFVLRPGAAVPGAGSDFYNAVTGNSNIAIGSGAFYIPVSGSGNHLEATGAVGSTLKFIQRRDKSLDKSPLYNYPFIESAWINAHCYNGLNISLVEAEFPTNNLYLVGAGNVAGVPATTGGIQILDEFTYKMQVSGHGDRTDWYNGVYNTPTTFGFYTTPDLSATAYTDAQKQDLIIQSLISDFNTKTQSMSFAICIASAPQGGAGEVAISDLGDGTVAIGDVTVIGYTCTGEPVRFVMDLSYQQTFADLDARLTALGYATAVMVPYLLPSTTTPPAGIPVAGTVSEVDLFAVVSIDEGQGHYDYRMATKRRINVGLVNGFTGTTKEEVVVASEGQGMARNIAIAYEANNGYEEVARPKAFMSYHVAFPNEVLKDAFYDVIYIEHCQHRTATSGLPAFNNITTAFAVVNTTVGDAVSNPYFGAANPQLTYLVATINDFIANNNLDIPAL